jgi:heat shock 70kDa protein 1/6/8
VFDAKRLIGRKFDDAEVQSDLKHYPFKVINKGGKPIVQVEFRGELKEFVSHDHYHVAVASSDLNLFL